MTKEKFEEMLKIALQDPRARALLRQRAIQTALEIGRPDVAAELAKK